MYTYIYIFHIIYIHVYIYYIIYIRILYILMCVRNICYKMRNTRNICYNMFMAAFPEWIFDNIWHANWELVECWESDSTELCNLEQGENTCTLNDLRMPKRLTWKSKCWHGILRLHYFTQKIEITGFFDRRASSNTKSCYFIRNCRTCIFGMKAHGRLMRTHQNWVSWHLPLPIVFANIES